LVFILTRVPVHTVHSRHVARPTALHGFHTPGESRDWYRQALQVCMTHRSCPKHRDDKQSIDCQGASGEARLADLEAPTQLACGRQRPCGRCCNHLISAIRMDCHDRSDREDQSNDRSSGPLVERYRQGTADVALAPRLDHSLFAFNPSPCSVATWTSARPDTAR